MSVPSREEALQRFLGQRQELEHERFEEIQRQRFEQDQENERLFPEAVHLGRLVAERSFELDYKHLNWRITTLTDLVPIPDTRVLPRFRKKLDPIIFTKSVSYDDLTLPLMNYLPPAAQPRQPGRANYDYVPGKVLLIRDGSFRGLTLGTARVAMEYLTVYKNILDKNS